MGRHRLLVHSAKQIVQVVNNGARVLAGDAMKTLAVLEADNTEGLSIVVNRFVVGLLNLAQISMLVPGDISGFIT